MDNLILVELTTTEILITGASLLLSSGVLAAIITSLFVRRKTSSEAQKNEVDTIITLQKAFLEVVDEVKKAKSESNSAAEQHSLERIASNEELADLRERVEQCEVEHLKWAECKSSMLEFLVKFEPELKQLTSQPTLLDAVHSVRSQIEAT